MTPAEVSIPRSRVVDFVSSVNGHGYRINVALPLRHPPAEGFGVVYVLDGNDYFGTMTEAARVNGNATDVVVVGIGYPDTPAFVEEVTARRGPPRSSRPLEPALLARIQERMYDLTLPISEEEIAAIAFFAPGQVRAVDTGGIDDLLRTIERDVKPRIAAMVPIDPSRQLLFGHSLGGLAVLRAFLTDPSAYSSYVAASPSIWWNDRALLKGLPGFAERAGDGRLSARLLLTAGAEERATPVTIPGRGEVLLPDVVDDITRFAEEVRRLTESGGVTVETVVFPHQGHGLAPWPSIGRAIGFAFPRPPPAPQPAPTR